MPVHNHYYADQNNRINTPESVARLAAYGPVIPVSVSLTPQHLSLLQALKSPIPPPVSGMALIDTGAAVCSIDEEIIKSLGSIPTGYEMVVGATGGAPVPQLTYPASLSFPGTNLPNITFTNFCGAPLRLSGIVALIGRTVLKDFVLVYNGPAGHISLSY